MKITLRQLVFSILILAASNGLWGCATADKRQELADRDWQRKQKMFEAEEKAAAAAKPETAAEHELAGDSYLGQGKIPSALIQYETAIQMEPKRLSARYKEGRILLKKGAPDEAEKEFREIIKYDAGNVKAYEGAGMACMIRGEFEKATGDLLSALELKPGLWTAHNLLGIIYDREGKYDSAVHQYETAIGIMPKSGVLYNNLGMSYFHMGDYKKAYRAFIQALRFSADSRIYNNLALSKSGRYTEAFEAFRKAGSEATAYNNLGCVYLKDGKYDEAARYFEKAIETNPKYYAKAHENLDRANSAARARQSNGGSM